MEVKLYNAMPFYGVQALCRKGNCRVQASTVCIHKNIHRRGNNDKAQLEQ